MFLLHVYVSCIYHKFCNTEFNIKVLVCQISKNNIVLICRGLGGQDR